MIQRHAPASSFWICAPLLLALTLRVASGPTANLSFLVLAVFALFGRQQLVLALAMSCLFTLINPGLAPEASSASVGRYLILFAAALSAFAHSSMLSRRPRVHYYTFATILLGMFFIGHSLLFSPILDVSILKALSWTLAMATLISAWSGLSQLERQRLERQLFGGLVLILLASLPLLATPIGTLRNGTGFQGVLNQPQAFGPVMGLLGAWAAARMLGESKPSWWLVGLVGACLGMVLMSEARTAGLAMVGGVALGILFAPGFGGTSLRRMVPGLGSARIWTVIGTVLVASIIMAPTIMSTVNHYLTKSGRADVESLAEIYDNSRGRLIEKMLQNIAEHPFSGIGFGIASEPWTMEVIRDPVLGLPTGASIEKGVMPLMILEELGLFGAMLVGLWLLRLMRSAACSGLAPFAVCLTVLLLNMGEAALTSPGGLGLIMLILLAWAYAGGRLKGERNFA